MKLKINQIQFLDFLLKRIQSKEGNFLNNNEKLSIVIDINGALWTGDFINYSNFKIKNITLDYEGDFSTSEITFSSFIDTSNRKFFDFFNFNNKLHNIDKSNLYLLLNELFEALNKVDCSNLKADSIIFNAENLTSNCKLPFIRINDDIEYDVVSLIVSNKI